MKKETLENIKKLKLFLSKIEEKNKDSAIKEKNIFKHNGTEFNWTKN